MVEDENRIEVIFTPEDRRGYLGEMDDLAELIIKYLTKRGYKMGYNNDFYVKLCHRSFEKKKVGEKDV